MDKSGGRELGIVNGPSEVDVLALDEQTFKDLEVFESATSGQSLFDFCNLTRTKGGATVLKKRMEQPFARLDRILAAQEAVCFVQEYRAEFEILSSLSFTTLCVDRYVNDYLEVITSDNPIEFGIAALTLRVNNRSDYDAIVRGVQFGCRLVAALRNFVERVGRLESAGELNDLIAEMKRILERQSLSIVPRHTEGAWFWTILGIDRVFRAKEPSSMRRLIQLVHEIDALVSLADVTSRHGFVMPEFKAGALHVIAEGLVHPLIQNAVGNPVRIDQEQRLLFLTGPNMAGKTTYMRALAIAFYFAHLGMGVAARSFRLSPAQRLFSFITLTDDIHNGISYFRAEALRVKSIARAVSQGYSVMALLDEPFKGTNVKDAFDASCEIVKGFSLSEGCLFVVSSHLIELHEQLDSLEDIDFRCFEACESEDRLRFEYQIGKGVSEQRVGMRVLRDEGVFELLHRRPHGVESA